MALTNIIYTHITEILYITSKMNVYYSCMIKALNITTVLSIILERRGLLHDVFLYRSKAGAMVYIPIHPCLA